MKWINAKRWRFIDLAECRKILFSFVLIWFREKIILFGSIFERAVVKMWATHTHTHMHPSVAASAVKLQSRFDLWVFKKYNRNAQHRIEMLASSGKRKKWTENDTSCHWHNWLTECEQCSPQLDYIVLHLWLATVAIVNVFIVAAHIVDADAVIATKKDERNWRCFID